NVAMTAATSARLADKRSPSGREADTATHAAVSAHIVSHAAVDRECLIDPRNPLYRDRLRAVVETQIRVDCEALMFGQIDAAECHRHRDTAIETSDVLIELVDL